MNTAILLYDGFTALDAIGPYEVLSRLPGGSVTFVAAEAGPVRTDNGMLTVMAEDRPLYQTQVGNPVPADAMPLVYPGSTVPAKRMPDGADHEIVIDWDAALAQVEAASV